MIKNNLFFIESIEKIVFIGFSDVLNDLIQINKSFNIPTDIISSTDQSKNLKLEHVVFDKIDAEFFNHLESVYNIENTLSTISTEYMEVVLKEENVPRKMDINIRKDKLAYIKDLASVNGMNILTKITESFL